MNEVLQRHFDEDPALFALATSEISKSFGAVKAVDELTLYIPRWGMTCHSGAERVGEVNAGEPAERDAAAGRWDGDN